MYFNSIHCYCVDIIFLNADHCFHLGDEILPFRHRSYLAYIPYVDSDCLCSMVEHACIHIVFTHA